MKQLKPKTYLDLGLLTTQGRPMLGWGRILPKGTQGLFGQQANAFAAATAVFDGRVVQLLRFALEREPGSLGGEEPSANVFCFEETAKKDARILWRAHGKSQRAFDDLWIKDERLVVRDVATKEVLGLDLESGEVLNEGGARQVPPPRIFIRGGKLSFLGRNLDLPAPPDTVVEYADRMIVLVNGLKLPEGSRARNILCFSNEGGLLWKVAENPLCRSGEDFYVRLTLDGQDVVAHLAGGPSGKVDPSSGHLVGWPAGYH